MTDRTKAMDDLIAQDADLIDKLRGDLPEVLCEKHWIVDFDAVEAQRVEAANRIAEQAAELAKWKALAETLAGALEEIQAGTYPRPLGKQWRMDASSSKHDRCIHDAWMYETCEGCLDAFVAQALTSYKEQCDV